MTNEEKVEVWFRELLAMLEAKNFWAEYDLTKSEERDYKNLYFVYYSEWKFRA